jgi:hypothetical protein
MVEKAEKSDFLSCQNTQKSGKIPAKTAQNPGKMTEKGRQNTGGGHPLWYHGAASSARRGLSGAICPAGRGSAALSYIAM